MGAALRGDLRAWAIGLAVGLLVDLVMTLLLPVQQEGPFVGMVLTSAVFLAFSVSFPLFRRGVSIKRVFGVFFVMLATLVAHAFVHVTLARGQGWNSLGVVVARAFGVIASPVGYLLALAVAAGARSFKRKSET